jgi:Flp pilus assembly pilin Flp
MKNIKNYIKRFIENDEGAEFIQFAIVIGIVIVLAVAIKNIADAANVKMGEAQSLIENLDLSGGGTPPSP